MSARRGDWIQTFTGRQFWPLDPSPDDVCIEDIAHALAFKCRFGGHSSHFYSVAEHSVLVMRNVAEPFKRDALLHDAAEAYLADIPRPVKPHLRDWAQIEQRVEQAIAEKFGLAFPIPPEVKAVDNAILWDERAHFMKGANWSDAPLDWQLEGEPLGINFPLFPAFYAERVFLNEWRLLTQ